MTSSKDKFRRIVAQRVRLGLHYMTLEKFNAEMAAQMEFYKTASDSGKHDKLDNDKVPSTDGRAKA